MEKWSGKILHISNGDKFLSAFIDLINTEFNAHDHLFFTFQGKHKLKNKSQNILSCKNPFYIAIRLSWLFLRAEKVILHGMFNKNLIVFLFFNWFLLGKVYWVMWGGDVYFDLNDGKFVRWVRIQVIKRIQHFVTYVLGDYDFLVEHYGARGELHESIVYLSNVFEGSYSETKDNEVITILVGNSADPSNNHYEIFERLKGINKKIKLITPLSYGDVQYREKVIQEGHRIFDDAFIPLIDFLPYEEYIKYLKKIDIAMFNHKRQQAMGNIINLLGFGKKIFLRTDQAHYTYLKGLGLRVFDIEKLSENDLKKLDAEEAFINHNIVKENFSRRKLLNSLRKIFE